MSKFQSQQINDQLANKVFKAFDKSMAEALSSRVKNRFTFKVSELANLDHFSLLD